MVKLEELKRINIFKDMPDHLLELISTHAQLSIFSTDAELYRIGENIDTFYMLLMGQVSLKVKLGNDIDVILDTVQSGSSFGLSSLVSDGIASSTATCQEPSEVITLSGDKMVNLFEQNKELGYQMMLRLARQYKKNMENRIQMIISTFEDHPEIVKLGEHLNRLAPIF